MDKCVCNNLLIEDFSTGDQVCCNCGLVNNMRILSENFFVENEILFQNELGDEEFGPKNYEKLQCDIFYLKNICEKYNVLFDAQVIAIYLFKKNWNQKYNKNHLMYACIYLACEKENYSMLLFDSFRKDNKIDEIICELRQVIEIDEANYDYLFLYFESFYNKFKLISKCDPIEYRKIIGEVSKKKKMVKYANKHIIKLFINSFVKNKYIQSLDIEFLEKRVCEIVGLKYEKSYFI